MTVLFSDHVISDYSPSVDGLLKVNNDHIGFYRVNHDSNMWSTISKQLQDNHLVKLSSVIYTHTVHTCVNMFDWSKAFWEKSCTYETKVILRWSHNITVEIWIIGDELVKTWTLKHVWQRKLLAGVALKTQDQNWPFMTHNYFVLSVYG